MFFIWCICVLVINNNYMNNNNNNNNQCSYTATFTFSLSFCPYPFVCLSQSVQLLTLSQQILGPVEVDSLSLDQFQSPGHVKLLGPKLENSVLLHCRIPRVAMWRSHMTLHTRGIFPSPIPNFWLEKQELHCCASRCHQLVSNSRPSSHSQRFKSRALPNSNPVDTPYLVPCNQIRTFPLLRRCVSLPSQHYGLSPRNEDLHLSQPQ